MTIQLNTKRARDNSITRLARYNDDKLVIYEDGAFILYKIGDVGYGAMDWCYHEAITYDPKDRVSEKEATKKVELFLGCALWR